jgi:multiple sugar transport system ATP-binding protein
LASVSIEHISRLFRSKSAVHRAIDDLSLSVADRELVVLVGPSGCGKTTTLRLIAGLEELSSGTIRIGDRVVNKVAPKDRDVAMVFQNYALYPHMTVFKNMGFGLKMRGAPKAEIRAKIVETAETLGLMHLLDRKPSQLSGGERQRVAVGRAIVRKPQVFLFDEPLSNLDATLRLHMRTELKTLQRDLQTTMIYVTHDQEEAMTLADRLAVLKDGILQQFGSPLDVYNRPINRFVAEFIGTPRMNFLRGRLDGDAGFLCFAGTVGRLPLASRESASLAAYRDREVVLGIRPQDVQLDGEAVGLESIGVDAAVRIVELLGDRVNVHSAMASGDTIVARVSPDRAPAVDQRVRLRLDVSNVHIFAPDEQGRRLN